ncbi:MAG: alkaline phosphatase family protein [Oscillospiraceae bacterium]|jgi:hypothetical protein|nr:alkaline phosphatase family protein [Oscillospiraceae bacterium]
MKRLLCLLLTMLLLLALSACSPASFLRITGDCEGLAVSDAFRASALLRAFPMEKLAALSKPRAKAFDLLLVGGDGMCAQISGDDLEGCRLVHTSEFGWEFKSERHPPSARVKNIVKIAVVSRSEDPRAARFFSGGEAQTITAGQLLLRGQSILKKEGSSQNNGKSATVYTTRQRLPLSEVCPAGNHFCAMGYNGETVRLRSAEQCWLESRGSQVDLILPDGQTAPDLAGITANAPDFSITETAKDALHLLEQGERVLIIELDGFGFAMLERAGEAYAPYLSSLGARRAMACYPPVSAVGLAAMLTGVTPDENGIHSRSDREMTRPDLFANAAAKGKTCAYVEGRHAVINTSLAPVLSIHDADTFENAKEALAKQPDLLFVHFHGIDDAAHANGPLAEPTLAAIQAVDGYVEALCGAFGGRVIITADHGLHATKEGGSHGEFLEEDLVVPYIMQ